MCRELPQNISGDGKRMSTCRIYLDSRERKSGTAADFVYALPYTLSIRERSLAMVDVVVVPNSIKTVGKKNSYIYVKEMWTVGGTSEELNRIVQLPEGYYTVEGLAGAIQAALNGSDKLLPGAYAVEYDPLIARYVFTNDATRFNDSFAIYTKESLEI